VIAGERGVAVGGNVREGNIITGDGNMIGTQRGVTLQEFNKLLAELRQAIPRSSIDPETAQVVDANVRVVEEQAAGPRPSRAIIVSKLKGVTELLTATAGGQAPPKSFCRWRKKRCNGRGSCSDKQTRLALATCDRLQ
jgi:hypothetical protein